MRCGPTCSRSTARTTTTRCGNGAWISASRSPCTRASHGHGAARSRSSCCYMYNHIGNFAVERRRVREGAALFGGVHPPLPRPELRVPRMRRVVGRAAARATSSAVGERGGENIQRLDPVSSTPTSGTRSMTKYGGECFADPDVRHATRKQSDNPPADLRRLPRACGSRRAQGFPPHFRRFFFGCEADDATSLVGVRRRRQPVRHRRCNRCSGPTSATGTCPTSTT